MKRVFLIVLDSCGIGAMPDAKQFGDISPNTLKRISASPKFTAKNLIKMGLGNIDGIDYLESCDNPTACVARMAEKSRGKDTTIGHWEIAGVISNKPLPTYKDGFPREIIEKFSRLVGRGIICNKAYSGTDVIRDYGDEHLKSGSLIVYTSADSVFQIAAHEDIVSCEELYEYCRIARRILCDKHAVGRVIARPFKTDESGNFVRTENRRDFSLEPPNTTMLDAIKSGGKQVIAVGKISDIFCGCGVSEKITTHSNREGMEKTLEILDRDFSGLCFVNLVDFDMLYGHRQDIDGYAAAFSEFDRWLPTFTAKMRKGDILIITADHGCDPGDNHTDHTREYTPLIMYGVGVTPTNLGTRDTFADVAATVSKYLDIEFKTVGKGMI